MKNLVLMKCLLLGGCVLLWPVAGCAPAPPPAASQPAIGPEVLLGEMQTLPRAQVRKGVIIYPSGALFSAGAALFYAGGSEVLDPLAAFLARHPQIRWTGTVHAKSTISGDHALALATARGSLLQRYLQRKGLSADQLSLSAEAGGGPDLTLQRIAEGQDEKDSSSSRENE